MRILSPFRVAVTPTGLAEALILVTRAPILAPAATDVPLMKTVNEDQFTSSIHQL
jgi:hypothetical protein